MPDAGQPPQKRMVSAEEAARMKYTTLECYDIVTLARLLCLPLSALRKLCHDGEFPEPILIGKEQRWPKEDALRWLELVANERWQLAYIKRKAESEVDECRPAVVPDVLTSLKDDLLEVCYSTGVYFLMLEERVVYIGSSVNPMKRSLQHRHGTKRYPPKEYDKVYFLSVPLEELLEMEKKLIRLFDPPLNKALKLKKPTPAAERRQNTVEQIKNESSDELPPLVE